MSNWDIERHFPNATDDEFPTAPALTHTVLPSASDIEIPSASDDELPNAPDSDGDPDLELPSAPVIYSISKLPREEATAFLNAQAVGEDIELPNALDGPEDYPLAVRVGELNV